MLSHHGNRGGCSSNSLQQSRTDKAHVISTLSTLQQTQPFLQAHTISSYAIMAIPSTRRAPFSFDVVFNLLLCLLACSFALAQDFSSGSLSPSAEVMGGITMGLGLILAFGGKSIMRLYCAAAGFLFGMVACHLALLRVQASYDMGPNRELIELICVLIAGVIGAALGLCLSQFAVFLVAVLFGLVVTMALLAIPGTEQFRTRLPPWGLALIVMALSVVFYFLLESYLVVFFTALVGSVAFANGLDAILKTGFNEELTQALTSKDPSDAEPFQGTEDMLPIVYAFFGCLVLGMITQVCVSRKMRRQADGEEDRKAQQRRRGMMFEEEKDMESGGAVARLY